jgi:hypothetical protein
MPDSLPLSGSVRCGWTDIEVRRISTPRKWHGWVGRGAHNAQAVTLVLFGYMTKFATLVGLTIDCCKLYSTLTSKFQAKSFPPALRRHPVWEPSFCKHSRYASSER